MSAPSGTFSIGDIPYFDGSLPGSPSSLVTSVLELMSLDVTANTNALSICPFAESDILLPKDKDTILYLVHVFLLLSGWKWLELNGKKGRSNGVPVGEKWFICGKNKNCPFMIKLRDVQSSNNPYGEMMLVELRGHNEHCCQSMARGRLNAGSIHSDLLLTMFLKVINNNFGGQYAEGLDKAVLAHMSNVEGLDISSISSTQKKSFRDMFRHNTTYYKEDGSGYVDKLLFTERTSLFEFYCVVRKVRYIHKDYLLQRKSLSTYDTLLKSKYKPTTDTMREDGPKRHICIICLSIDGPKGMGIVEHCGCGSGSHYAHVNCWKHMVSEKDFAVFQMYTMRDKGVMEPPQCVGSQWQCKLDSIVREVTVVDKDMMVRQRFKAPDSFEGVSTWPESFTRTQQRICYINTIIECADNDQSCEELIAGPLDVKDCLPKSFPKSIYDNYLLL
jgi:hypothetical protein